MSNDISDEETGDDGGIDADEPLEDYISNDVNADSHNSVDEELEEDDTSEEGLAQDDSGYFIINDFGNTEEIVDRYLDLNEGIAIIRDDEGDVNDENVIEEEDDDISTKKTSYDLSLPVSHSYLGDGMEELHGRTIHSEGEIVMMPLFFQPGVILVPGQTLPLNLFHPQPISMMKKVIAADKTFGLMLQSSVGDGWNSFASVGVTCEIFSVREDTLRGITQLCLKGEGRQRFRILSKHLQMDGVTMGKILILPDAAIPPYPQSSLIYSHHQHNAIASQVVTNRFFATNSRWKFGEARYLTGFNPKDKFLLSRSTASLPGWIYKLYNPYFLMDCLMTEIGSWNKDLCAATIPINPTDFSHWITANLPLTNEMKIELLEIDSAILRLRRQIEIVNKCTTTLACNGCQYAIANKGDLFSLSRKGPMAAYVNPGGRVHETVTFYKAKNLTLQGSPTTQYSWFPGYAWTVASCKRCNNHMGWKFQAVKKGLEPLKFWGLARASLKPVFKESNIEDEEVENDGLFRNPISNAVMYESNI